MTNPGAIGNAVYFPNFTTIATKAYRHMGVIDETESPSTAQLSEALDTANSMIKELAATGIHVWTEEEALLFLQAGQNRYVIADPNLYSGTIDNAVDAYSYAQTTLSAGAASGATSVALTSAANAAFASASNIGVALASGTTFWTTQSGAASGSSIALAAGLSGAAVAGGNVFAFAPANAITRPLKVPSARRLTFSSANEIPMQRFSRQEYEDQPNKTTPGPPTAFFYAPKVNYGELFVWPTPMNAWDGLRFTWYRPLNDLTSNTSNADIPQEWVNTLDWWLAQEMAADFSVPPVRWDRIQVMAQRKLDMVLSWDRESEDVQFGMDWTERRA